MRKKKIFSIIFLSEIGLCLILNACVHHQKYPLDPYRHSPAERKKQINDSASTPLLIHSKSEKRPEKRINTQGFSSLTLQSALQMAIENNPAFQSDRLEPEINQAEVALQEAVFDPVLSGSLTAEDSSGANDAKNEISKEMANGNSIKTDFYLKKLFPAGSTLELGLGGSRERTGDDAENAYNDMGLEATLIQPLLRGRGSEVNLASLHIARLDFEISIHELRGSAETLITQVELAYWDYFLAKQSIEIYENSLELAQQGVEEVQERILVGEIAPTELVAAEAEAATRKEQLIVARNTLAKQRMNLIRLLGVMNGGAAVWDRELCLKDTPEPVSCRLKKVEEFVKSALKNRADLNQARLQLEQNDLEVIRTRNGLLPKLDLFIMLGGSRYANSFSDLDDKDGAIASYAVGINFETPLGNRRPQAEHKVTVLSKKQAQIALSNMESLIQVDIRSAYVDVESADERVKATSITRKLRDKTFNIEQEKFRVGKSTAFLVSQAKRDMVASQISEIEAIVEYRKSLSNLYRMAGLALNQWGITIK